MNKKVKLVSLNMGISLVVLKNGKEQKTSYSLRCPSPSCGQPYWILAYIADFLKDELEIDVWNEEEIQIAKPKGIKAPSHVSHEEFNKRIKELVS